MNRRTLLTATASTALVARSNSPVPMLAAPATPAAVEPEVVIVDAVPTYLGTAVVPALPAAPAVMSLQRATLAPASSFAVTGAPDAALLIAVEAGTARIGAGTALTVTGGDPAGTPAANAAGDELLVSAGGSVGGSLSQSVTLQSPASADLLIFRIDPEVIAATAPATPVTMDDDDVALLAIDQSETVPAGPALLEVLRFTFMPGGSVRLPATSPATALIVVESGEMAVEMGARTTVHRALPGAGPAWDETYEANTPFTVAAGQSMLGAAFAAVSAANTGLAPLSILMAVMQPAPAA